MLPPRQLSSGHRFSCPSFPPVLCRCLPGVFLEGTAEIIGVGVSNGGTDFFHALIRCVQQRLGLFHPNAGQILYKGLPRLLLEQLGEIIRTDIDLTGNIVQRQILGKMRPNILLRLLDQSRGVLLPALVTVFGIVIVVSAVVPLNAL